VSAPTLHPSPVCDCRANQSTHHSDLSSFPVYCSFAYIEFADAASVDNALILNDTEFKGRKLKVMPKRTNLPPSALRGGRGGRGGGGPMRAMRGRGRGGFMPMMMPPFFPGFMPMMMGGRGGGMWRGPPRGRGRGAPRGRGGS
jgi:polyadenylate-binding protein 2